MHVQLMTTFTNPLRTARPRRALKRLALVALAWMAHTLASAQGLPVQQLTVAFTNAFPNGSVDALTMPNSNSAAIAAVDPILTGGSTRNLYTALVWVTNPATSTLDLIYADAEQHKIWRLPGPQYQHPVAIFTWSGRGSGPAYPVGLSADPSGNLYVISPTCLWDRPGVWVLPITATGTYAAPLLIDSTFNDPTTHKPVLTLALAEVTAAGSAATPVSAGAPAWNALDLLVLVDDIFNTRVIRYSQAQIQSVLGSQRPLQGPASTVVTQTQFSTQAIKKIPPFAVGMDIGQDPTTQDMTLLFSTADGRILDFDSGKNAFITPYAINLGLGLTRVKVGTFQGAKYAFVGQLPGRILEFAAPPSGGSNTTPFAIVSKGVSNPSDLAVTQSGSTVAGQCINAPCVLLPQLSLQFSGPGTANIPANAPIVVDSCVIGADPRVTNVDSVIIYSYVPLDLAPLCANMPNVLLSANVFGASGPTGAGIYVAKITSTVLNEYQSIHNTLTTPINNTLTQFFLNPSVVLGTNPPCGSANGPVAAWGPLPSESVIPEGTLIDITVACTSDPPPAGKSNHPSVVVQGTVLGGLNASYIDGEFNSLQAAFNNMITPQVEPPTTQIIDPTGLGIVQTVQNYITNSLNYFNQENYNCALNTLATGGRYVNSTVTSNPGDFLAGPPPFDDENPSGTLLMRFDHLYYDVNIFAGNPPITTDALNPATVVPACGSLNGPSGLAFNPATGNLYVANYNNGQVLVYAPTAGNGQMVLQPSLTLSGFTNPVRLAFAPSSENSALSGELLVADTGTNFVSIFNGSTLYFTVGKPPQTAAITRPLGVAADPNGFLYVAENEGTGNGGEGSGNVNDIQVYTFVTGGPDLYATYDEDHNGLAFQSVGDLWYDSSTNDILVGLPSEITFYTAFGGGCGSDCAPVPDPNETAITSGVNGVIGIATDANNDVDVTNFAGATPFAQFAPNTGAQTTLTLHGTPSPAIQNPQGVAVDSAGNIYVSNTANNLIYVYHTGAACNPGPSACYWYTIQ